MGKQLSIKDSQACEAWLTRAHELSDDAYQAMKDTAQIVAEIKAESRGSLADEMVSLSNAVLSSAKVVTETFEQLTSVTKKVLDYISGFIDKIKGAAGTVISSLGK